MEATAEIPKLPPMPPEVIRSRARRAKAKAKPKPKAKVKTKPKSKAKPKRPYLHNKTARKSKAVERSERLDMRLTKAEKAKIIAKAKKARRTVTSLVAEAIGKIK